MPGEAWAAVLDFPAAASPRAPQVMANLRIPCAVSAPKPLPWSDSWAHSWLNCSRISSGRPSLGISDMGQLWASQVIVFVFNQKGSSDGCNRSCSPSTVNPSRAATCLQDDA